LHGKIGGKFAKYIDIENKIITSGEHFISLWLQGYEQNLKDRGDFVSYSNAYDTYMLRRKHKLFRDYLFIFLKRVYIRNFEALSEKRLKVEEAEIWIGQENANYGIFALIYTDLELADTKGIFNDMKKYLELKTSGKQLQFHILEDFFTKPLPK
jgi:hypothetical protein